MRGYDIFINILLYHRGIGSKSEDAFRKDYGRLGELRSLIHRDVPFVTLTATATETVRKTIIKDLGMTGCVEILGDPNKTNVRYAMVDVDSCDLYGTFSVIIKDIEMNQNNATKVLVFCRRKEHVKELFELFSQCLGPKAYHRPTGQEPLDDRTRLFAMYHKKTHKLVKETIETEFCKENGTVRVVFCTIAFGMGVNVKGAYIGVHLGPSSGLDDYLQESGRIGRSSDKMSHAVLLKFKGCTRSRNISKTMKEYVKNTDVCRRIMLLKPFSSSPQCNDIKHSCCDVCARSCRCLCTCGLEQCVCPETCCTNTFQSPIETHLRSLKDTEKKGNSAASNEIPRRRQSKLHCRLMEYRADLAKNMAHEKLLTGLDLATGYSRKLVDSIVRKIHEIRSIQALKDNFPFFSDEHVEETWEIICEVMDETSESETDDESDFESVESRPLEKSKTQ